MNDVLIHYLEVNFAEIAEQFAHARSANPTSEERSAAAERLRGIIRRLRSKSRQPTPAGRVAAREELGSVEDVIAAMDGDIDDLERSVLERFLELFKRSMARTHPRAAEAAPEQPAAAVTPVATPAPVRAEANGGAAAPAAVEAPPVASAPASPPVAAPPAEDRAEAGATAELPPAPRPDQQHASSLQTILLAAAQQALDLLQADASQVYTIGDDGAFVLRAAVPSDSMGTPEATQPFLGGLLNRVLEHNEVLTVEDLAEEPLTAQERGWVEAGYHGFAAIALSPPLERPVGVLALLRRTRWRMDRRDALRLEDLAVESVTALRAHSLAMKVEEVATQQERIKLAREIHDGLASDLAAVVALFKYYDQRRVRDPEDAAELLPQLRSMTEEILAGARNILQSLRPKTVRSEGLLASVVKLVDHFGRIHLIETSTAILGEENGLTPEEKEGIFQVLRESLSNVQKHSQARNVWVSLDLARSPWALTVRDDGRGFDLKQVVAEKAGSYGLVGMRERAELIDARLEVVSQPGGGTSVTFLGPSERFA
jgi:signal transduction histidine kinase